MENNILDINEFMSKTKFSINERFTLTHFNILPEEYEAFCYKMTISYLGEGVAPWGNKKYYIGWHKGNIEDVKTQKYISSSKEINEIIKIKDTIYMATNSGLISFKENNLYTSKILPPIYITSLKINETVFIHIVVFYEYFNNGSTTNRG